MKKITFALVSVTFVAVVSWGLAIADIWLPVDCRTVSVARPAAATATIVAVLIRQDRRRRDQAMLYMADAVTASRRAAVATTAPLRAVRAR